jgi:hypothetical protein
MPFTYTLPKPVIVPTELMVAPSVAAESPLPPPPQALNPPAVSARVIH